MEILFFATPAEFRAWLAANHDSTDELWAGFHKKGSGRPSMTWPEAVDEALCFGWIDGVRYSIDETSYRQRFTPRRAGSVWSTVNVRRAHELIEAGRMRSRGLEAFERRKENLERRYSFEQAEEVTLGDVYGQLVMARLHYIESWLRPLRHIEMLEREDPRDRRFVDAARCIRGSRVAVVPARLTAAAAPLKH